MLFICFLPHFCVVFCDNTLFYFTCPSITPPWLQLSLSSTLLFVKCLLCICKLFSFVCPPLVTPPMQIDQLRIVSVLFCVGVVVVVALSAFICNWKASTLSNDNNNNDSRESVHCHAHNSPVTNPPPWACARRSIFNYSGAIVNQSINYSNNDELICVICATKPNAARKQPEHEPKTERKANLTSSPPPTSRTHSCLFSHLTSFTTHPHMSNRDVYTDIYILLYESEIYAQSVPRDLESPSSIYHIMVYYNIYKSTDIFISFIFGLLFSFWKM